MTPSLWQWMSRIFSEAHALPAAARDTFIDAQCGGNQDLAQCLRSMVIHREQARTLLAGPMIGVERFTEFLEHDLRTFQPGEIVCRKFRVERFIAEGGMGEVYAATDLGSEEEVALKTVRPSLASGRLEGMLRSEIQIAHRVTHHNVARLHGLDWHEFGGGEDRPRVAVLSMELIGGETLGDRLVWARRLKESEALPIAQQIARGLDHAHAAGVIHRDLKPGNVMITGEGASMRAAITDFGLARLQRESEISAADADATMELRIEGTPGYIAPEQLMQRAITPAVDIYAFGAMLFEMVTGRLPFTGATAEEMARKRLQERAPSARSIARDLDPRWDQAIARCLELDPKLRPKSAGAVIAMLRSPARLARRVAAAAAACLTAGAITWMELRPAPLNPQAVEAYKYGEHFLNGRDESALKNAAKEFDKAVRIDPRHKDAWVGLAEAYSALGNFNYMSAKEAAAKSGDAARHALALDHRSERATCILAYNQSLDVYHWREAGAQLLRCVEDAPNDAKLRLWYGAFLGKAGRSVAALEQLREGLRLDPLSIALNQQLAIELWRARDFHEFEMQARKFKETQPRDPIARYTLAMSLIQNRNWEDAEEQIQAIAKDGDKVTERALTAMLAAARGDLTSARRVTDEIRLYSRSSFVDPNLLASLYADCNEPWEAVAMLEAGFERGENSVLGAPTNPTMDRLLGNPGYEQFLRKIGWPADDVALPLPPRWKIL